MTKQEFKERVGELIIPYDETYPNQEQPIITWNDQTGKATFTPAFWDHLPLDVRTTIEVMMDQIEA